MSPLEENRWSISTTCHICPDIIGDNLVNLWVKIKKGEEDKDVNPACGLGSSGRVLTNA